MSKNTHPLSPKIISKLNNLYIKARFVVEGFIVGLHKSPYHGFSVEFSEHRAYGYGDEIRHIDWKLWGKTDKYFVKQFEEETNLKSYLLLDKSSSMYYKSGNISKIEYANILTASLTYLMLKQQDAVGLTLFDNQIRSNIPPKSKRSHINVILSEIENISKGSNTNIAPVLHKIAEMTQKRGLVILISDLLDSKEDVLSSLQHFRYKGHEVIVFHILDPQELKLEFNQLTRFQDMESEEEIITEPWNIQKDYQKKIQSFCNYYKNQCSKNNIDYILLNTDTPLDRALSEYLIKRKRMV
tara:strand:+ start:8780 stop:9673 length:894 start_codon:yes stop_codon:yes gene_type:complete